MTEGIWTILMEQIISLLRTLIKKFFDYLAEFIITFGGGVYELGLGIVGKLKVLGEIGEEALEAGLPEFRGLVLFY